MTTFTFDHNVIIDLEEKRKQRYFSICKILESNFEQCAITAVSASENPPIKNFLEFKEKIQNIPELKKLKNNQILKPMGMYDFAFFDWHIYGDGPGQPMVKLKEDIASLLFPKIFPTNKLDSSNRNKLADVMTFWCHVYHKRDIFITSDSNFHKKAEQLKQIAQNYSGNNVNIFRPHEALTH